MKALFVCIQNAGRSQMAAAFATEFGLDARSAGSNPAPHVHPEVVDAMRELGFELAGSVPRTLTPEDAEWADVVVTMGCGDACPLIPGTRYIDWDLPDPHGLSGEGVRDLRDRIRLLVAHLVAEANELDLSKQGEQSNAQEHGGSR